MATTQTYEGQTKLVAFNPLTAAGWSWRTAGDRMLSMGWEDTFPTFEQALADALKNTTD